MAGVSADPGTREVAARFALTASDPTFCELAVMLATSVTPVEEQLRVTLDGAPLAAREIADEAGTRLAHFEVGAGLVEVDYRARVTGGAVRLGASPVELSRALRPSRYAPSDRLTEFARATFRPADPAELATTIAAWVHGRLDYEPEASHPLHGAVETLERGAGVCRDFAHLTAALLRALDVPARLVAVYAPHLAPPDFHAVVEAWTGERWVVLDATRLAPRRQMLRIATGRDAADIAWATTTRSDVVLERLEVSARADRRLEDDPDELVELG